MSQSHTNRGECSPFHSKSIQSQSKPQWRQHILTTTLRYPYKTGPWRKTKSAVDWEWHCFWTFSVCCDNRRCDHLPVTELTLTHTQRFKFVSSGHSEVDNSNGRPPVSIQKTQIRRSFSHYKIYNRLWEFFGNRLEIKCFSQPSQRSPSPSSVCRNNWYCSQMHIRPVQDVHSYH